nr:hypothetical protein OH820_32300 [Streptomyces sp. NBC_00857]
MTGPRNLAIRIFHQDGGTDVAVLRRTSRDCRRPSRALGLT